MSDIKEMDKSSMRTYLEICKSIGGTSVEFDFTDSVRNGCSILIGGQRSVRHIPIEEARDIVELKKNLEAYENGSDKTISVTSLPNYFVVRLNNFDGLEGAGFDSVQVKMIESSILRQTGLVLLSSNSYDSLPFTLRSLYSLIKDTKPHARVTYLTERDTYIDFNTDILFVEANSLSEERVVQIVNSVVNGTQVFLGVVAGNSMMALEKLKMTSPMVTDNVLSSFNFLNCMIHQRTLPKLCPSCKLPIKEVKGLDSGLAYRLTFLSSGGGEEEDVIESMRGSYGDFEIDNVRIANKSGCSECFQGYIGETFCAEIIIPDYDMLDNVRKGDYIAAWKCWRQYRTEGFVGMRSEDHAIMKMGKGDIDPAIIEMHMEPLNIQLLLEDGTLTSDEVSSMMAPTE